MNIYFRVDGNSKIGMGHFIRCVSIAQMVQTRYAVTFVLKDTTQQLVSNYLVNKFDYTMVNSEADWLKRLTEKDAVVLDGYKFTITDQAEIKRTRAKLILIDDFTNDTSIADVIINHQIFTTKADYPNTTVGRLCLGADYLMIRNSFIQKKQPKRNRGKENIFICLGGSASKAQIQDILAALILIGEIKKISILVGETFEGNPFDLIKSDTRIAVFQSLSDVEIIDLINDSDIGIVTASTIAYESLYLNMPVLVCYDNSLQMRFYNSLCQVKNVLGIGSLDNIDDVDFKAKLDSLAELNAATEKGVFGDFSADNFIALFDTLSR